RALYDGSNRFGLRIVRFSVQGNHLHLLVEAAETRALLRGIKGVSVRIAKRMNALMQRHGRVIGDRYHARTLRTPTQVRRAITYIRDNPKQPMAQRGQTPPTAWVDPYSSDSPALTAALPPPRIWLVRVGWRRAPP